MQNPLLRTAALTFALLCAGLFAGMSCEKDEDKNDDASNTLCDPAAKKTIRQELVLRKGERFILTATPANKDCHADFRIEFAWADAARRRANDSLPPLIWQFQPHPGFFYFPAPPAERRQENGEYLWASSLNIGAKNHDEPNVQYEIEATLRSDLPEADSVLVRGEVTWVDKLAP